MDHNAGYNGEGNFDKEEDIGPMRDNIKKSIRDLDELDAEKHLSDIREQSQRQLVDKFGRDLQEDREKVEEDWRNLQDLANLGQDLGSLRDVWGNVIEDWRNLQGWANPPEGWESLQDGLGNLQPDKWGVMKQTAQYYGGYRGDCLGDYFTNRSYSTPLNSKDFPKMEEWGSALGVATREYRTYSDELHQRRPFLEKSYKPYDNDEVWQGKKVLGEGGQGQVGLWERVDPITGRTLRIAVKQSDYHDFSEELGFMQDLQNRGGHCVQLAGHQAKSGNGSDGGGSDRGGHFVRLAGHQAEGSNGQQAPSDNAPDEISGLSSNELWGEPIVMEFCEGGSLLGRIMKARKSRTLFEERVVWRIFECLIKGLNMMDHGAEEKMPGADGPAPETGRPWQPITHFDLKPHNILLTVLDGEHHIFPRCKIADFGLAKRLPSIEMQLQNPLYRLSGRGAGTPGYYAPEQFSLRWQHGNWQSNKELTFGTHTNIWMLGIVMYQLCTLRGPPIPRGSRCGNQPGLTYGPGLKDTEYSEKLKSLIWKCLAEKPSMRATLEYCGDQIHEALMATAELPKHPPVKREEPTEWKPLVSDESITFLGSNKARHEDEPPVEGIKGTSKEKPPTSDERGEFLGSGKVAHEDEPPVEGIKGISKEKPPASDESITFLGSNKARHENEPPVEGAKGTSKEKPPTSDERGEFLGSGKVGHEERPPGSETSAGVIGSNVVGDEPVGSGPPQAGGNKLKHDRDGESEDDQDKPKPKKAKGDQPPDPPPGPAPGPVQQPRRAGLRPRPIKKRQR